MGELADHIQLQNERNAKRRELRTRIENHIRLNSLRHASIALFVTRIHEEKQAIAESEQEMYKLHKLLKELDLDEAPLQARQPPETNRGVSID